MFNKISIVTGNANKLSEYKAILGSVCDLHSIKIDLPELQGDVMEIAKQKCKTAFEIGQTALFTEDTSLCFHAMKGLPGPYIKWFLEDLGHDGLNKMLVGFNDNRAYAQCILSYMEPGMDEPELFVGITEGKIVPARGPLNFGWDPIFEPEGYDKTYAELDKDTKNQISHRFKATELFIKYLESKINKKQKVN